jgi:hypothetical protein
LQIPLRTRSGVEAYVANREWRDARLPACPLHPLGGCSFARHGSYTRVRPQRLRVARWYCPEGHRTFSLLPDFLAARLPGLLTSIEDAVAAALSAKSMEAAADTLRGLDVTLPSALRWLYRRVRAVQVVHDAVSRLGPIGILTSGSVGPNDSGERRVLFGLRRSLSPLLLHNLPAPLGFQPSRRGGRLGDGDQHDMGPDGGTAAHYATMANVVYASCNVSRPIQSPQSPRPPPTICFVSGAPTAVCKATVPDCTFNGSGASAPIVHTASWMNEPS